MFALAMAVCTSFVPWWLWLVWEMPQLPPSVEDVWGVRLFLIGSFVQSSPKHGALSHFAKALT
jgi:hypothetical protein